MYLTCNRGDDGFGGQHTRGTLGTSRQTGRGQISYRRKRACRVSHLVAASMSTSTRNSNQRTMGLSPCPTGASAFAFNPPCPVKTKECGTGRETLANCRAGEGRAGSVGQCRATRAVPKAVRSAPAQNVPPSPCSTATLYCSAEANRRAETQQTRAIRLPHLLLLAPSELVPQSFLFPGLRTSLAHCCTGKHRRHRAAADNMHLLGRRYETHPPGQQPVYSTYTERAWICVRQVTYDQCIS